MVGEDPAQQLSSSLHVRPFRHYRSRDRIVTTDSNAQHYTPAKNPHHLQRRGWNRIGQANQENESEHPDDELVAIDESSPEYIAKVAEGKLTDDIADVRCGVDQTSQQRREMWLFVLQASPVPESIVRWSVNWSISTSWELWVRREGGLLVNPDGGHKVDNEQIVRIQEEADTTGTSAVWKS